MKTFALLALLLPAVLAAHIDLSTYPLTADLRPATGSYRLHWSVEGQSIRFAVNVSTTGWVGLGLSPTGGMRNSDIVIGWVNDQGQAFLHDRFATGRSLPPVDAMQDWILEGGEQENGFTILAFRRNLVTCDEQFDKDIQSDTARMIFSWNNADPVDDNPNQVMYHETNRGASSVNLLGGQQEVPPDPADLQSFDITVNITLPSERTTYWCSAFELPAEVKNKTRYITKVTPVIQADNELNVHHFLIYECTNLNSNHIGYSAPCNAFGNSRDAAVSSCRRGVNPLIAGWAVGGEKFVYPADVAYPVGGDGNPHFLVMETHYDNPDLRSNISDSSGMKFFYTSTERTFSSGFLFLGHDVQPSMIIPPGVQDYRVFGECSSDCTSAHIPEEGISVFSSTLHTHLAGVGLVVHHIRRSETCGDNGWEQLKPIDQNLQYDFNFQQTVHLPEIINVKPGDILRLECIYNTTDRDLVTLGGESTMEEMCLVFLQYYPRMDLTTCVSRPALRDPQVLQPFLNDSLTPEQQEALLAGASFGNFGVATVKNALSNVSWTSDEVASLKSSVVNGPVQDLCISPMGFAETFPNGLLAVECEYQAPDPRAGICDSTTATTTIFSGAGNVAANVLMVVAITMGLMTLMV